MTQPDWKWYAGSNEEEFHSGPFDTREEAIIALDGYGGFIIEARKLPLALSSCFDAVRFFDEAEESVYELANPEGELLFEATDTQIEDLEKRVRKTIDQWQDEHNLVFFPWFFSQSRNLERINGEVGDPEQPGPFFLSLNEETK